MDALAANWETPEALQIRKLIMRVPKFGNDEDYVDFIVKDVFDSYLELLPQYRTLRTGKATSNFLLYNVYQQYYLLCTKWF